jgi:hypothetical protein
MVNAMSYLIVYVLVSYLTYVPVPVLLEPITPFFELFV